MKLVIINHYPDEQPPLEIQNTAVYEIIAPHISEPDKPPATQ